MRRAQRRRVLFIGVAALHPFDEVVDVAECSGGSASGRSATSVSSKNGASLRRRKEPVGTFLVQHGIGAIPYLCHDFTVTSQGFSVFGVKRSDIDVFRLEWRP